MLHLCLSGRSYQPRAWAEIKQSKAKPLISVLTSHCDPGFYHSIYCVPRKNGSCCESFSSPGHCGAAVRALLMRRTRVAIVRRCRHSSYSSPAVSPLQAVRQAPVSAGEPSVAALVPALVPAVAVAVAPLRAAAAGSRSATPSSVDRTESPGLRRHHHLHVLR
jgi:hypothetical protein